MSRGDTEGYENSGIFLIICLLHILFSEEGRIRTVFRITPKLENLFCCSNVATIHSGSVSQLLKFSFDLGKSRLDWYSESLLIYDLPADVRQNKVTYNVVFR